MSEIQEYNITLDTLKTMQFLVPHKGSDYEAGICSLWVKPDTQIVKFNDVHTDHEDNRFVHLDKFDEYVSTYHGVNFKGSVEEVGFRFMYTNEIVKFCKSKQFQNSRTKDSLKEVFSEYLKYLEGGKICRKLN